MKTLPSNLTFCMICILLSLSAYGQSPGKFNYQAVVRGTDQVPVASQAVSFRFSVLDATENILFTETQNASTNGLGMVSLYIGETNPSGLREVEWWSGPLFLKVECDPAGGSSFLLFDTKPLQSVPYALFAGMSQSFAPGKLEVTGNEQQNEEEALFEVKRNDGQTVFAVYPEGVRIYVDTSDAKGTKGGFAVGGFTPGKAGGEEYMLVTPDSIRLYIQEDDLKGSKGGFAVGGFSPGKLPGREFLRVTEDSTRIYVDSDQIKGSKGGFAVGGFTPGKYSVNRLMNLTRENFYIGESAGENNATGVYNSFLGYQSGRSNTAGDYNIFIGYQSGYSNLDGEYNTAIGYQSGYSNLGPIEGQTGGGYGSFNSYLGYKAGYASEHGAHNTFMGYASGENNQSDNNTFLGSLSGYSNTTGLSNTFIGTESGRANTIGQGNTFLGRWSGWNVDNGSGNTLLGAYAGADLLSGSENVIIGSNAMANIYYGAPGTAASNVIIGAQAGKNALNGSGNVFIGYKAGYEETGSNLLYISNSETSTPLVFGNFSEGKFRINGDIEHTGLITAISDVRLKTNITHLSGVTEKLLQIHGISYDWSPDEEIHLRMLPGRQIGVIAQEVETVFPEIVSTTDQGYKMVDYSRLTPLLLEAIREQQEEINRLRSELNRILDLENQLREIREQLGILNTL